MSEVPGTASCLPEIAKSAFPHSRSVWHFVLLSLSSLSRMQVKKLPPIDEIQRDPLQRDKFIDYSAFDAKATFKLYEVLRDQLQVASYRHPRDQEVVGGVRTLGPVAAPAQAAASLAIGTF